jgi:hypothetical protein
MGDDDWDRAVDLLSKLPPDVVTPLLRGDIVSAQMLRATLARGPSTAWRVLRPFVRAGN